MTHYTGPDEYPIKVLPDTPLWSENFAAMFTDSKSNLAVMYSTGRWHGDLTLWREFVMVAFPDGRFLFHRGYGRNADAQGPGGCLSKYDILEPGRSVQLTFDGPMSEASSDFLVLNAPLNEPPAKRCVMNLQFDSDTPVWNMKGESTEAATMAGGIHIEQIGKSNGHIEYDGKTFNLSDGYSIRDHSRGVRDMTHFGAHNWINGSFADGRAFFLYAMRAQDTTELGLSTAAVIAHGKLYSAKVVHTELITKVGDAGKTHKVILESELGQMDIEIIEVLNIFPYSMLMPFDTALGVVKHRNVACIYDESVRMTCDGIPGIGWSERGIATAPL
ncbi:hypothetical protein G8764_10980 [Pseudomaricurvus alcaniphilus]|uniref:hypothetical protein n=1 Tax=Pseudomaricurvus alcaniphilus TaxID=1166482 RepID=UPI00140AF5D5|nr:hypothetical protein [Pseudomaricurvus alcaniphilus]NHN37821.1 hypothetical protein [Pseudomaricurvus alcaniphilus]